MQKEGKQCCLTCFQSENLIFLGVEVEENQNIASALNKHFWFTEDDFHQAHICASCWKQIEGFHRFYGTVEELYKRSFMQQIVLLKSEPDGDEEAVEFLEEEDDSSMFLAETAGEGIKRETIDAGSDDDVKEEMATWTVEVEAHSDSEPTDSDKEEKAKVLKRKIPKAPEREKYKPKSKEERMKEDEYIRSHVSYTCEQCGTSSVTFALFQKHSLDAHGNKSAFIECCGNRFYKKIRLYQHVQTIYNPETFRCETCQRNFTDSEGIKRHLREFHATEAEKPFKCDRCDKSFTREYKYKLHVQEHLDWDNQSCKCEPCGKVYKSQHILNNHIKLYHTKPTKFICDICAKGFHLKSQFLLHKMEHDSPDQLKMQCSVCSRWLKNRLTWRRHMQGHRGQESKCDQCGHVSPHPRALKGHIRRQHNEQRQLYRCQYCAKTFVQLISLKEHVASVHVGAALHSCSICSKSFNSSANMHSHKKNRHPDEWLQEHNSKFYGK